MNDGSHWQIYIGIAALLILALALIWPDRNDKVQNHEISSGTVNQVLPVTAIEKAPMRPVSGLSNPFVSSGFDPSAKEQRERPATPEPEVTPETIVKAYTGSNDTQAITREGSTADWGKWRKADERLYGYLGGPPGPGKPAE